MYNQNLIPARTKNWHNSSTGKKVPPAHAKRVYLFLRLWFCLWVRAVKVEEKSVTEKQETSVWFQVRMKIRVSTWSFLSVVHSLWIPIPMYEKKILGFNKKICTKLAFPPQQKTDTTTQLYCTLSTYVTPKTLRIPIPMCEKKVC
jgi:hypothetical protein